MSSNLLTKRAICASEIALAESIRSSKVVPHPMNLAYLTGAKAAMKLLNKRLADQRVKSSSLAGDVVVITRETQYAEMQ